MKRSAHTFQLCLLPSGYEKDVQMLMLPENLTESETDALNKRLICRTSEAKGDVLSVLVLHAGQVRMFDVAGGAKVGSNSDFEQAFGLPVLLTHEADGTLSVNLGFALAFAPEH
jgi:hypothetical protein